MRECEGEGQKGFFFFFSFFWEEVVNIKTDC